MPELPIELKQAYNNIKQQIDMAVFYANKIDTYNRYREVLEQYLPELKNQTSNLNQQNSNEDEKNSNSFPKNATSNSGAIGDRYPYKSYSQRFEDHGNPLERATACKKLLAKENHTPQFINNVIKSSLLFRISDNETVLAKEIKNKLFKVQIAAIMVEDYIQAITISIRHIHTADRVYFSSLLELQALYQKLEAAKQQLTIFKHELNEVLEKNAAALGLIPLTVINKAIAEYDATKSEEIFGSQSSQVSKLVSLVDQADLQGINFLSIENICTAAGSYNDELHGIPNAKPTATGQVFRAIADNYCNASPNNPTISRNALIRLLENYENNRKCGFFYHFGIGGSSEVRQIMQVLNLAVKRKQNISRRTLLYIIRNDSYLLDILRGKEGKRNEQKEATGTCGLIRAIATLFPQKNNLYSNNHLDSNNHLVENDNNNDISIGLSNDGSFISSTNDSLSINANSV